MTVKRSDDRVEATLDDLNIVCKPDMIWHFTLGDKESGISAQFVHAGNGFPHGTAKAHRPPIPRTPSPSDTSGRVVLKAP